MERLGQRQGLVMLVLLMNAVVGFCYRICLLFRGSQRAMGFYGSTGVLRAMRAGAGAPGKLGTALSPANLHTGTTSKLSGPPSSSLCRRPHSGQRNDSNRQLHQMRRPRIEHRYR